MNDKLALDASLDDQQLLARVVEYYHQTLKETTAGFEFLSRRGISNGEAIDQFRIGLANRTLGLTLPSKRTKAGNDIRHRLQEVGLYRQSGHEHYNGCLVFPVTSADGSGRIVDIYGRKLGGKRLRKGTPLDLHLHDGERRGVWNIEAFMASDEIILCENLLDALTFWNHGYRNVSCTFSSEVSADLLTALGEFQIGRVLTCSAETQAMIEAAGIECSLLNLPNGLGANAFARQVDDPAERLGDVVHAANRTGHGLPVSTVNDSVLKAEESDFVAEPRVLNDNSDDASAETLLAKLLEQDDIDDESGSSNDESHDEDVTPGERNNGHSDGDPIALNTESSQPHELAAEINSDEVVLNLGHRRYRVRGLSKNLSFDVMKANLLASTAQGMFVDTFDLYAARHRRSFVTQAAAELDVEEKTINKDLGRLLLKLEEVQDDLLRAALEPKPTVPAMTTPEKEAALELLHDPRLLDRILDDFDVVGEETNKLLGYLGAVSRKLDQPLALIIQSSSAAGKTSLMEAVLSFVPPEDQVKYSAMTGQSLFYMGETNIKHKILAIVEEEGVSRASYALKLLQSEGELMIASTGKDGSSGRLITQEYRVEGPVMMFLTTTAVKIDEELLNRCIVLSVDEDREQTKAIHQRQRHGQTLDGLLRTQDQQQTIRLHRNAQRLLRPLLVANPFAESLTFLNDKTRTRRDHLKYLTLIRAVTLLHQYQRPIQTVEHHGQQIEYIDVTLDDIAVANRLANEVLGRSTEDLPPQTRRLLGLIDAMVTEACKQQGLDRADYRFSRRDIREQTCWGNTQLKVHLKRLEELEYLLIHRGGRGQSFVYELLYDAPADNSNKFLAGLIDVAKLRRNGSGMIPE